MKNYQKLSRIALPLAVFFASFSSIFIRWSTAPSLIIAFYRMMFAGLLVLPYFGYRKVFPRSGEKESGSPGQTGKNRAGPREILLSLGSGFFLAAHFATWISSLRYTSIASSVLLVNTHPVMVFFLSRFFLKEGGGKREFFYVILTVVGSIVLSWGDMAKGNQVLLGDLLAILGALSVGAYMTLGRVVRRSMGVTNYTTLVYFTSAVVLFVVVTLGGIPLGPYSAREFALFLGLAFFCTILGHSVYSWALKYVSSTYLSLNILIEPILAGILAFFIFREVPTVVNGIGAFIVLVGIYGYSREK